MLKERPLGRLESILIWFISVTDEHILETQNSVCSMVVGIIILIGGEKLYENNPKGWQIFESLPHEVWGVLYFVAGLAHLLTIRYKNELMRKWVLLIKAALWLYLGTALFVGIGWFAPAGYIYYIFALVAFRGYFKIKLEVHED